MEIKPVGRLIANYLRVFIILFLTNFKTTSKKYKILMYGNKIRKDVVG